MKESERTVLYKSVFSTIEGEQVLADLKEQVNFDRFSILQSDRDLCFAQGKKWVVELIQETMNIKTKYGRRNRTESTDE